MGLGSIYTGAFWERFRIFWGCFRGALEKLAESIKATTSVLEGYPA